MLGAEPVKRTTGAWLLVAWATFGALGCGPDQSASGGEPAAAAAVEQGPANLLPGASLRMAYARAMAEQAGPEYHFVPAAAGTQVAARNGSQRLKLELSELGLLVKPSGPPSWSLTLRWSEMGRPNGTQPPPPVCGPLAVKDNRATLPRCDGPIEEWYLQWPARHRAGF